MIRIKEIILSADGESIVYLVPDIVAENLQEYCLKFCDWVYANSKFAKNGSVCYNQEDFINYLNEYLFPDELSKQILNLGWTNLGKNLPKKYGCLPYYNF